jgi:hypothetical protein
VLHLVATAPFALSAVNVGAIRPNLVGTLCRDANAGFEIDGG